jgi:hypothetical protein
LRTKAAEGASVIDSKAFMASHPRMNDDEAKNKKMSKRVTASAAAVGREVVALLLLTHVQTTWEAKEKNIQKRKKYNRIESRLLWADRQLGDERKKKKIVFMVL